MLKLSQILKYAGILVGVLGSLRILFAELELILQHPIALIVTGLGAICYFVGLWEARHEAIIAGTKVTTSSSSTIAIISPTTTIGA